jgi:hypothetical protein
MVLHLEQLSKTTPSSIKYLQQKLPIDGIDSYARLTRKKCKTNPENILRMLDMLKKAGNPHYQFHDDFNAYKERCKESDPQGHEVLFPTID